MLEGTAYVDIVPTSPEERNPSNDTGARLAIDLFDRLQDREIAVNNYVALLQGVWRDYSGQTWEPSSTSIRVMLCKASPTIAEEAIRITASKVYAGQIRDPRVSWEPYAYGVIRNISKQGGNTGQSGVFSNETVDEILRWEREGSFYDDDDSVEE